MLWRATLGQIAVAERRLCEVERGGTIVNTVVGSFSEALIKYANPFEVECDHCSKSFHPCCHSALCKLSQEEIDSLDHFLCSVNCEKLYKKGRK